MALVNDRDPSSSSGGVLGLKPYFRSKVEALDIAVRDGTQNLRRLEAQRNELNSRGKNNNNNNNNKSDDTQQS